MTEQRAEFDTMPRIRCERCNKPIALGTMPSIPPEKPLVIQCKNCKQLNRFPRCSAGIDITCAA